jgi:hypothetical protein
MWEQKGYGADWEWTLQRYYKERGKEAMVSRQPGRDKPIIPSSSKQYSSKVAASFILLRLIPRSLLQMALF